MLIVIRVWINCITATPDSKVNMHSVNMNKTKVLGFILIKLINSQTNSLSAILGQNTFFRQYIRTVTAINTKTRQQNHLDTMMQHLPIDSK